MSDYTPTTGEVRGRHNANGTLAKVYDALHGAGYRRADIEDIVNAMQNAGILFREHDAAKRTEWEAEQGETEWEYGIEYAPGNEEFEGQDLPTIRRRVKYIRRQGGYYSTRVRALRRRPAGDSEPVPDTGAES